jgi:hypothetical protein
MSDVIRIFVGCSPNNEDLESQAVLEWSLRKHHPADDLSIEWMQLSDDPSSFWYSNPRKGIGWNPAGWATPFSAFRWAIPARCNFQGRGIYLDSDMIALADIAGLWNQELKPGKALISKGVNDRFCVTLFDCAAARKHLPTIDQLKQNPQAYRRARRSVQNLVQKFEGNWNCLDGEDYKDLHDPDIKILHYTSIPHQLHLKYSLPRLIAEGGRHWFTGRPEEHWRADFQQLFDDLLIEAIENGYSPEKYRKTPFGQYKTRWAA